MAVSTVSEGLQVSLIEEMNTFIRVNALKEVTNPIYLQKNIPTPDGVLSYDIFGITTEDRATRMAYIDLHGHFMYPLAAKKLYAYDRRLSDILYSTKKYTLTNKGELILDNENGSTGPEFLYSIWGKVKVKDKNTIATKEVQAFFDRPKDELFVDKFLVIPAQYRDINEKVDSKLATANINSIYSSIIAYCQNLDNYSDTFTMMKFVTQARVQSLLVDLYDEFVIRKVKGSPAKFGMLRKFMMSKNIDYSAWLVISAPILNCGSPEDMILKYGEVGLPLPEACSCFLPFIQYHLKRFFDNEFISGGKYEVINKKGETQYVTINATFDDEYISKMILKYIHSPSTRFDPIEIPSNEEGIRAYMSLTGRFNRDKTTPTNSRAMTITDLLYKVATEVLEDKYVYVTRFPLISYNNQFAAKVKIISTIKTTHALIGDKLYRHWPVVEVGQDSSNSFINTLQMNNTYLPILGGDYDGDRVSVKPVYSKEATKNCRDMVNSKAYLLDASGSAIRTISKDFILTGYCLTKTSTKLKDANRVKPKYII